MWEIDAGRTLSNFPEVGNEFGDLFGNVAN